MPTDKHIQNQRMLSLIGDFTAELESPTVDELDEQLRADGINPTRVVSSILGRVQKATWRDRAAHERRAFEDVSAAKRRHADAMNRQQMLALLRRSRGTVSAQFRNADELSDDDMRQLITDLGLLDDE